MYPTVLVVEEKSGVALLSVGFDEVENVKAFFFDQPETAEEKEEQAGWRRIQAALGWCRGQECEECVFCMYARRYMFALTITALSVFVSPMLALSMLGLTCASIPVVCVNRFLQRH